ncbi:SpoIIE family protein phosphatase [Anaerotruncus colihominis]|nr:SpoIIE family protein phosphatase [Anaerotruncus colihominis]
MNRQRVSTGYAELNIYNRLYNKDNLLVYEKQVKAMQNRTAAGLSIGARARQTVRAHRLAAGYFAYAATGFVAANAFVLGGLAPFGIAFAASAKPRYYAGATLGATLGYLMSFHVMTNVKYIVAMALLFGLRVMLGSGTLTRFCARVSGQALTAVSLGLPSIAIVLVGGGSVYDASLAVAEVLLACCASYFFTRTAQALELGVENMRQTDVTSLVITFGIAVLALVNLRVLGVSVGRVLAVLVILLAAQAAREAGGAIAGVAAGVAAGVVGGNYTFLMGTYGLGGLLAGVFAPVGRAASAGAFIVVNLFALLASRRMLDRYLLIEIFIASLISILIPQGALRRLKSVREGQGAAVQGDTYKAMLTNRIDHVAGALRDVAETTRQVNERLSGMVNGDLSSVYHCAADRVCRKCRGNATCWQLRYTDTSDVFNNALSVLRRGGELTENDFPQYFVKTCPRVKELAVQMNRLFEEYAARESVRRKVAQVRGVVTDQFEGMALMVDAMGRDLDGLATQDTAAAGKVREYLQSLTVFPDLVTCTVDGGANMTVEVTIPTYKLSRLDMAELTVALSDICGRDFDLPATHSRSECAATTLTFAEKAAYTVKWGATQLGNSESKLCGDSFCYVDGQNGRVNVILSDGMGSGGAAAVDSTMTAELLRRLIEAGVSLDAALKLVNSALLVKSGDESLSTIDIVGVDLYTGCVDFYKAGAAPTFLRKSGRGGYVESSSLPVGILGGVTFEKNTVTLREGDLVVMVSDGALAGGFEWLVSDLEHYAGDDPKELSEQLAAESKRRRSDGHEDDITVIVLMLERGV